MREATREILEAWLLERHAFLEQISRPGRWALESDREEHLSSAWFEGVLESAWQVQEDLNEAADNEELEGVRRSRELLDEILEIPGRWAKGERILARINGELKEAKYLEPAGDLHRVIVLPTLAVWAVALHEISRDRRASA